MEGKLKSPAMFIIGEIFLASNSVIQLLILGTISKNFSKGHPGGLYTVILAKFISGIK